MRSPLILGVALALGCTSSSPDSPPSTPETAAVAVPATSAAAAEVEAPTPPEAPALAPPSAAAPTPSPASPAPDAQASTPTVPQPAPEASPPLPRIEALVAAKLPPTTGSRVAEALVPEAERLEVTDATARRLDVRVIEFALWVTDGSARAPLGQSATDVWSVTHGHDGRGAPTVRVEYQDESSCDAERRRWELPARTLRARLENAAAMKPHRTHDFAASARGFAQAAWLDPSLDVAWTNLACALAMDGKTAEAVGALEPVLRRAPLRVVHKVLSDPELASLREQPALTALRAETPGTASVRDLVIAYSSHLSLVAVRRHEDSWGSSNFIEELQLFDATTGAHVLTLPLVDWRDTDPEAEAPRVLPRHRARVDARLDATERFLRDLGFSSAPGLELGTVRHEPRGAQTLYTARFPAAGLGLAVLGSEARVLRGNEVLGVARGLDFHEIRRVGYDPDARVAFVEWTRGTPEGCSTDVEGAGFSLVVVAR